ncbi:sulfite exporter TauE/SafE family protein [Actinomyces ruminis]|uniref:Probable membrane transporter protein n=1 Tax=Actinomyces ruminis TaxID=1937003 RepID=A0ABX4M8H5_9ACTO|nr:sulfite exporter TauE/SafE family protein [Actinomyces ruminis]PHP51749.1 sulfite exporter TauE/SafE family protein [Actinomyces ruminis]
MPHTSAPRGSSGRRAAQTHPTTQQPNALQLLLTAMSPVITYALLFLAGVLAAIVGYLVGMASLVSYPAMLALGVPPVVANASNTVSLIPGGIGSLITSWDRLRQIRYYPLLPQALIAVVGGLVGGALLLVAPPGVFEAVVPWLVLLATVLVALSPRLRRGATNYRLPAPAFLALMAAIMVYSGYFGAGAGVLFFALCTLGTPMNTHAAVVMKTPMLTLSNVAAAVLFIVQGRVDWGAAIAVGLGSFAGGYVAPLIQRLIPERVIHAAVVVGGLALTVWLLLGF